MSTTPSEAATRPGAQTLQSLQALLENLQARQSGWQQAQQLMAAQLAPHFSPYSVYRSHEVDVSRHLALLLNPEGTHGQGRLFWDAWVKQVLLAQQAGCADASVDDESPEPHDTLSQDPHGPAQAAAPQPASAVSQWLQRTQVLQVDREHRTTELKGKNRRAIDLCVHVRGGLLAIENKPWRESVDELGQLDDYAAHLALLAARKKCDWTLVYLGHGAPSSQSLSPELRQKLAHNGHFVCVSWGQLLEALKQCLPLIQAPKVRWFVEDLVQMMERDLLNYTDSAEMEHNAKAFSQSRQALHNAFLLRDTLAQWQGNQLKKLEQQLKARCTPNMELNWKVTSDNPRKRQAYFTLSFPGRRDVVMRMEWYDGFANAVDFYWGVYGTDLDLEQSEELGKALTAALQKAQVALPKAEDVEAGWPLWSFFSTDPVFTSEGCADDSPEEIVHPWLSMEREQGDGDFVSLVLQRHAELAAALAQVQ